MQKGVATTTVLSKALHDSALSQRPSPICTSFHCSYIHTPNEIHSFFQYFFIHLTFFQNRNPFYLLIHKHCKNKNKNKNFFPSGIDIVTLPSCFHPQLYFSYFLTIDSLEYIFPESYFPLLFEFM